MTFNLYQRENIWYCALPVSKKGKIVRIRISTGCRGSKAEAYARAVQIWKNWNSGKAHLNDFTKPTLEDLCKDWWDWERCPYLREKRRRGFAVGKTYARAARSMLKHYFLPVFGKSYLCQITPRDLDEWEYGLCEKHGLSGKTANSYVSMLRVMFDWWWRQGLIPGNPVLKVLSMADRPKHRGILTLEEARRLFLDPTIWSCPTSYAANLLAASTGMRAGEIQALRVQDVGERAIIVRHSWSEEAGLKGTKTGVVRKVPISPYLRDLLLSLVKDPEDPEAFIFSLKSGRPATRGFFLDSLRRALVKIGISEEEQHRRNLVFHSWRHFLNTRLRASGLPDAITRRITGHASEEMTERYTGSFEPEDLQKVREVVKEFSKI